MKNFFFIDNQAKIPEGSELLFQDGKLMLDDRRVAYTSNFSQELPNSEKLKYYLFKFTGEKLESAKLILRQSKLYTQETNLPVCISSNKKTVFYVFKDNGKPVPSEDDISEIEGKYFWQEQEIVPKGKFYLSELRFENGTSLTAQQKTEVRLIKTANKTKRYWNDERVYTLKEYYSTRRFYLSGPKKYQEVPPSLRPAIIKFGKDNLLGDHIVGCYNTMWRRKRRESNESSFIVEQLSSLNNVVASASETENSIAAISISDAAPVNFAPAPSTTINWQYFSGNSSEYQEGILGKRKEREQDLTQLPLSKFSKHW